MSSQQRPEINIAADEINALIHAYLVDSGFIHSAFVLRGEANLDRSPLAKMLFPRGQLTELLAKALLYTEVETHWKKLPGACNQPFSLTGAHTCRFTPAKNTSALAHSTFNAMEQDTQDTWIGPLDHSGRTKKLHEDEEMTTACQCRIFLHPNTLKTSVYADSDASLPPPGKNELPSSLQRFISSHEQEIFQCAWNPFFPEILATGSKDSNSVIWKVDLIHRNLPRDQQLGTILHCGTIPSNEERDVSCIEWSRDGNLLATGSMDPYVRVWSKSSNTLLFRMKEHKDTVGLVRFSPNAKHLVSVGLDGCTMLWDVEKKRLLRKYQATDVSNGPGLQDAAWINETSFAVTWPGFLIHIFSTTSPTSKPFRTYRGHMDELNTIRVSHDRKLLASVCDDQTARVWAIEPLKMVVKDSEIVPAEGSVGGEDGQGCLHVLRGHSALINCHWVPEHRSERKILVTIGDDFKVCIWDAVAGTLLKTLADHKLDVYGFTTSPDTEYYATASIDGWVYIYSSRNYEMLCSWTDRSTPELSKKRNLYEVDWHKDGKLLAVCVGSGDIALLDVSHLGSRNPDAPIV